MAGIVSFGAYIPIYRLNRRTIGEVWGGGEKKGEKAIANFDEDSITMAVEAGRECLKARERSSIDALYFASTTPPYKEKQAASIIAAGLDLREDIFAADITDSIRSGTIALKIALDTVKSGSARSALVIASDCRIPPPNSALEPIFGDGAAAFLVGREKAAVEIEGSYYITSEFLDFWRLEYDRIVRTWEDRFIREEGFLPYTQRAISGLLKYYNLSHEAFAEAVLYAPDARLHREVARILNLDAKTKVHNLLFDQIGNTGTAFVPMMLVASLENAEAGDLILVANYGDGAEAHILRVTDEIRNVTNKESFKKNLDSKVMLDNYGRYIKFRDLMEFEHTPEFRLRTYLPGMWRDRQWVYRFHGHKCKKCAKEQFPMQKRCMYCGAASEFLEEIPLADRKGTLFTYGVDERAPVVDPPNVVAAVNLGGGARFYSQMTDRDAKALKVGMPMELTFRRIHDALGIHNYFWKCRPAREEGTGN